MVRPASAPEGIVLFDVADSIATLTLNNPEKLNPMTSEMRHALVELLRVADDDTRVRAVVITGAGRGFCAGADVNALRRRADGEGQAPPHGLAPAASADVSQTFAWTISRMAKPVVAAINGPAVGLGFGLAMACDLRVAAEDARIGARFPRLGVSAEEASSFLLPRMIGLARALDVLLSGRLMSGREAHELGLVNRVAPAGQALSAARALAGELAENSPLAVAVIKHQVYGGLESTMEQQLNRELTATRELLKSRDHAEGIRSFMEKRQPRFEGR